MRSLSSLTLALLSSTFIVAAACGGGGSGDDAPSTVDAHPDGAGGTPDAMPQDETFCADLPAVSSGVCEVSGPASTASGFLIKGDILAPDTIYRGGQVAVDGTGKITCVGCDCDTS